MGFQESEQSMECEADKFFQVLLSTYEWLFTTFGKEATPLLAQHLVQIESLLRLKPLPPLQNQVLILHASHTYASKLRAAMPTTFALQEPLELHVENILDEYNYRTIVKALAGENYRAYEKDVIILVEQERHLIGEGVRELGIEQTCSILRTLHEKLTQPTLQLTV